MLETSVTQDAMTCSEARHFVPGTKLSGPKMEYAFAFLFFGIISKELWEHKTKLTILVLNVRICVYVAYVNTYKYINAVCIERLAMFHI